MGHFPILGYKSIKNVHMDPQTCNGDIVDKAKHDAVSVGVSLWHLSNKREVVLLKVRMLGLVQVRMAPHGKDRG